MTVNITKNHEPCPFCGSKDLGHNQIWTCIECIDCGAQGPFIDDNMDWSVAWDLWDKRAKSKKLVV